MVISCIFFSLSTPRLCYWDTADKVVGIALIVGTQVGSGIFSSPGVVVAEVGSVGASLLVWLASGLLAWTGAR